jgi:hypothetical protein
LFFVLKEDESSRLALTIMIALEPHQGDPRPNHM